MSGIVKVEAKTEEEKKFGVIATTAAAPEVQAPAAPPATIYICANCTARVTLTANSQLKCATCEHLTGSSTVFYKVRTEPTTYDTI